MPRAVGDNCRVWRADRRFNFSIGGGGVHCPTTCNAHRGWAMQYDVLTESRSKSRPPMNNKTHIPGGEVFISLFATKYEPLTFP